MSQFLKEYQNLVKFVSAGKSWSDQQSILMDAFPPLDILL